MNSTPEWHFLPCAIRSLRLSNGITGPEMQRRLGTRGKAGFYRREGTIVQTVYGRLCFTRKPRLTVDALSAVADAMGEFPEAFWAEARALCPRYRRLLREHLDDLSGRPSEPRADRDHE